MKSLKLGIKIGFVWYVAVVSKEIFAAISLDALKCLKNKLEKKETDNERKKGESAEKSEES